MRGLHTQEESTVNELLSELRALHIEKESLQARLAAASKQLEVAWIESRSHEAHASQYKTQLQALQIENQGLREQLEARDESLEEANKLVAKCEGQIRQLRYVAQEKPNMVGQAAHAAQDSVKKLEPIMEPRLTANSHSSKLQMLLGNCHSHVFDLVRDADVLTASKGWHSPVGMKANFSDTLGQVGPMSLLAHAGYDRVLRIY